MTPVPEAERTTRPLSETRRLASARTWMALGALFVAIYATFMGAIWRPAIVGPDDHGYVALGTMLASEGRTWFTLDSPIQYVGRHWLRDKSGRYVSRYSPGMGVAVAAVAGATSVEASVALNVVLALVSLAGLGILVGTQLGAGWGLASMVALGASPVFIGQAMLMGSHLAVTALLVWGIHLLLRWREKGGVWRASLAGVLFGFIPLVRPAEAVLGLGVAVFLVATARADIRPWRHVLWAIVGAALAFTPMLLYNWVTFGGITRTAYAITHSEGAFHPRYTASNALYYARYLLRDGLGILALLAVPGVFYLLRREATRVAGRFLALLIVPVLVLYLTFHFQPISVPALTVRYLLPVLPLAIYAALALVSGLVTTWPVRARSAAVGLLLSGHVAWGVRGSEPMARRFLVRKELVASVNRSAFAVIPSGSVVFSNEELFLSNLDIHRRWRVADRLLSLDTVENAFLDGEMGSRGMAKQRGKRRIQTRRFDGLNTQQRDSLFAVDASRWGPGVDVYYVGMASGFDRPTSHRVGREKFEILATRPLNRTRGAEGRSPPRSDSIVVARWKDPSSFP